MGAPPTEHDLTADQPWRAIPMPGSEQQLEIVRLASPRDRLTMHARFPAGFDRPVPGGYAVSEEVLVLEGELEIGDETYVPGDLVVVPAWYARRGMRSPRGCRVLAWFGGMADFLPVADLHASQDSITRTATDRATPGSVAVSDAGTWSLGSAPDGDGVLELVSADRTTWRRGEVTAGPADLVRRDR